MLVTVASTDTSSLESTGTPAGTTRRVPARVPRWRLDAHGRSSDRAADGRVRAEPGITPISNAFDEAGYDIA